MNRFTFAATISATLLFAAPLQASTWIHCGDHLDVEAGELTGPTTLVIEGGLVERIEAGLIDPPEDATAVDLSELTCLPGLMDMHTHVISQSGPNSYIDRFTRNPADLALQGSMYARRTLEAGFTTVRDLGDSYNVSVALRNSINAGQTVGPRIYTSAKSLATTGGHADPTNSWRADLMGDPGPREGVVDGVSEAREGVRQRYKDGADLIKITATGGVLSVARSGLAPQFHPDELEAIISTANDYGMHVAAHAHGKEGMLRAVRAGVRSIEHGTMMDEEVFEAMIENDTYMVATIMAGDFVARMAEVDGYFPELVRPKARTIGPMMQDTFGRAWRAGVRIAFGTDSGVSAHGENAREFELMVETGMPEIEAIRAATLNSADLLGISDTAGAIKPGYWADIIAVEGSPLENIGILGDIRFVMKDGEVYVN
ncbi:MAG: amidohydrolase family protein [Pseudomonadota bacterium]